MRMQVRSLASINGLRIQGCHELWCRSQMPLGSCVAVAVALIQLLAWELPYAIPVSLKNKTKQDKKNLLSTMRSNNKLRTSAKARAWQCYIIVLVPVR